jgi:hypothetical protein
MGESSDASEPDDGAVQFLDLLISAFLSFHEPSEEYMLAIRMEFMKGI